MEAAFCSEGQPQAACPYQEVWKAVEQFTIARMRTRQGSFGLHISDLNPEPVVDLTCDTHWNRTTCETCRSRAVGLACISHGDIHVRWSLSAVCWRFIFVDGNARNFSNDRW